MPESASLQHRKGGQHSDCRLSAVRPSGMYCRLSAVCAICLLSVTPEASTPSSSRTRECWPSEGFEDSTGRRGKHDSECWPAVH